MQNMATIEAWHKIVQYSIELKQYNAKIFRKNVSTFSKSEFLCVSCVLCACIGI